LAQRERDERICIGVRQLRANLSGVLRHIRHGTTFLVMSRDEVTAEIRPPSNHGCPRRVAGMLKGKIRMAGEFDVLPDDLLSAIDGKQE